MPITGPKYPLVRTAASPTSTAASTQARSSIESSGWRFRPLGSLIPTAETTSDPPRLRDFGAEQRRLAAPRLHALHELLLLSRRHPRSRPREIVARHEHDGPHLGDAWLLPWTRLPCGLFSPRGRAYLHAGLLRAWWPGGPQAGAPGEDAVAGRLFREGRVLWSGVGPDLAAVAEGVEEQRSSGRDDHLPGLWWGCRIEAHREHERRVGLLGEFDHGELPRCQAAGALLPGDQPGRVPRTILPDAPELAPVAPVERR